MKKQIGVLTATRAEFGLLKPLILRLLEEEFCDTRVLVTGMHLSPAFGNTYKEIEEAGIPIAEKIECITEGDTPKDISNNMAMAMTGFGDYFANNRLDLLIVLGDRYETMAVCMAAMVAEIPIAHIHGGEATEGLIDEAIRHSITKMSQLHFASTDIYRNRIIQMGEQPDRVFNVGALAVENTKNTEFISREDLGKDLGIDLSGDYAVVTFHPVTLEENSGVEQFDKLMEAMDAFPDMKYIITKANADAGGRYINSRIDEYAEKRDNVVAVTSLGVKRYLSAVKGCCIVLGNSSSGITEAPCLHVPTVNIGDRQKGRLMPDSVICCEPESEAIIDAMKKAVSDDFREKVKAMTNPFGDGNTSEKITEIIRSIFEKDGNIGIVKNFYDIEVNG
ncbi:UDP-N-acetylglucosamine 2-epimerase [Butyrivibrio sp. WCD2001]|uniref:UDP-N-acetylglucosamine 2-epimerase n=1 Tax=Butyrivibrio sp. WCD2001 TaxID=1280681 RepID=UPI0004134EB6|nr:UDP-N-acetylglucosamine 2-epimerase [Butyrivibrio sp. WCD2001]